jgi:hypothetical protein
MAAVSLEIAAADAAAIEELLYHSVWLIDHGQADRAPETLAPDGTVRGLGEPMDHEGFSAWARARAENTARKTRHLIGNVRLSALPDGRVRGSSTLIVVALEGGDRPELSFVGDQEDVFVRGDDGAWLIVERKLTPIWA